MTDHHPDHGDPLRGRDPYPRDRIDLLPLHDARRDLLEEIVSDTQQTGSRKAFLAVGIAAALAVIAGGAWFAVAGDGTEADDPVVAASSTADPSDRSTATDEASTADPAEETSPDQAGKGEEDVRMRGVRTGRVISAKDCRDGLSVREIQRLRVEIDSIDGARRGVRQRPRDREDQLIYLLRARDERPLVITSDCRVLPLRDVRRGR